MKDLLIYKSKFPFGLILTAIFSIFIIALTLIKGMPAYGSFMYGFIILFVGTIFHRHHYSVKMYDDAIEINFFIPFKKNVKIRYEDIYQIQSEEGLFMEYESMTESFISTDDKIIIRHKIDENSTETELKVVSGIGFNDFQKLLLEKSKLSLQS